MTNTTNYDRALTVAELINWLGTFDPNLPVHMAMNQEYQNEVTEHDLTGIIYDDGAPYVLIGE